MALDQFGDDWLDPDAPLLPSERRDRHGSDCSRVGDDALRTGLAVAVPHIGQPPVQQRIHRVDRRHQPRLRATTPTTLAEQHRGGGGGAAQRRLRVRHGIRGAERPDDPLGSAEVGSGHAGKQVVLVWWFSPPIRNEVSRLPLMLRDGRTWRRRKSGLASGGRTWHPLRFGANVAPQVHPDHCEMHTEERRRLHRAHDDRQQPVNQGRTLVAGPPGPGLGSTGG